MPDAFPFSAFSRARDHRKSLLSQCSQPWRCESLLLSWGMSNWLTPIVSIAVQSKSLTRPRIDIRWKTPYTIRCYYNSSYYASLLHYGEMGFGLRTPHLAPDVLRWKARWVSFRACPPKIDTSMAQGSVHSTLLSVRSSTFQLDMSVQQQWVHVVRVLEVCSGFFFLFSFFSLSKFPRSSTRSSCHFLSAHNASP